MEKAIETSAKDSWSCVNSDLPYPLYFYAYSRSKFGDKAYANSIAMTQSPTIQNVMYCPFLYFDELTLTKVQYDKERFGTDPLRPSPAVSTDVYRVSTFQKKEKQLGYVLPYRNITANPGRNKPRSWKNEGKLWQYPYRKIFVSDGMNTPLELKTTLLKYDDANNKIMARLTISNRMSYSLYVAGYKGDDNGLYEAMVSGDSLELPCSSSAYNQWYATSKNQTANATRQMIESSFLNTQQSNYMIENSINANTTKGYMNNMSGMLQSMLSMAGNAFDSGGSVGNTGSWALNAGINAYTSSKNIQVDNYMMSLQTNLNNQLHAQQEKFAIQNAVSASKDMATTPPSMISMGSDFIYGYNNNNQKLKVSTFDITEEVAEQIGDYFSLYGYLANKVMDLNVVTKSRHFYNYVKTTNAMVKSRNGVPKTFVGKINEMFNNGVTLWHKEYNDVEMHDYTYDNYEEGAF